MTVREALPGDAEAIARVQVETWRATYRGLMPDPVIDELTTEGNAARWGDIMANRRPRTVVWVAQAPGQGVVGFASGGPSRDESVPYEGELYALYVLPGHQGRGAGRALFGAVAGALAAVGFRDAMLRVLAGNERARAFYESLGGALLGAVSHDVGGQAIEAVGYGFGDLPSLAARCAARRA